MILQFKRANKQSVMDAFATIHGKLKPAETLFDKIQSGLADIRLAMTGAMRKAMAEKPEEFDPRAFLKAAVAAARDICRQRFEAFGSAGQASHIKPLALEKMAATYR